MLKHAGFGDAVNVTLGLSFVRTSVDHGTALDLAGTGRAEHSSLVSALALARELARACRDEGSARALPGAMKRMSPRPRTGRSCGGNTTTMSPTLPLRMSAPTPNRTLMRRVREDKAPALRPGPREPRRPRPVLPTGSQGEAAQALRPALPP